MKLSGTNSVMPPVLLLNLPQNVEMNRFVVRAFDVAVHDRRGRRNAQLVRRLDELDPLRGGDPSRRYLLADLVDQYFRGCSGKAADAGVL